MFYLVDLVKKFVYSCVSPGTSIQRQICGMWNLNSTTTLQVCFWACSTLPHSPSPHHVPLPSIPSNTWKTQKTSNGGQWEPCASSLTIPCCCLPPQDEFLFFFFSQFIFVFKQCGTPQHPSTLLLPSPTASAQPSTSSATTTVTTAISGLLALCHGCNANGTYFCLQCTCRDTLTLVTTACRSPIIVPCHYSVHNGHHIVSSPDHMVFPTSPPDWTLPHHQIVWWTMQ